MVGTFGFFSTSMLSQIIKNVKGGPFVRENFLKVSQCRKKLKGDPLVSPGIVSYAEKEETRFGSVRYAK